MHTQAPATNERRITKPEPGKVRSIECTLRGANCGIMGDESELQFSTQENPGATQPGIEWICLFESHHPFSEFWPPKGCVFPSFGHWTNAATPTFRAWIWRFAFAGCTFYLPNTESQVALCRTKMQMWAEHVLEAYSRGQWLTAFREPWKCP